MQNIKVVRLDKKMSQKDFADKLKITQSYLSALETGRKNITNKLARVLFDTFKVSPEWFYNGTEPMYNSSIGNRSGVNDGENADNITRFLNKSRATAKELGVFYETPEDKAAFYSRSFDQNKVDYYYRHTDLRLDRLLSSVIEDYKRAYTSYQTLCMLSAKFGAPDFMNEKFPVHISFEAYKNEIDSESTETHTHITDEKLFKCIRLINYEQEIEHWNDALYRLITYINQYADLYKPR